MGSKGKTTGLSWAASVWGSPDERGNGMLKNLKSTANAVEALAIGANSSALLLDETNLIEGKELQPIIYTIAAGTKKLRLRVDGNLRTDTACWSTFAMLSGETGLAQKYEASAYGAKMGKGAGVRLLDFNIDSFNAKVPADTIARLKALRDANYGWAGDAFVKRLVAEGHADNPDALYAMHRGFVRELAGNDAVGVTARAANLVAIMRVAVELACQWGILPVEFRSRFAEAMAELWRQVLGGKVFNDARTIVESVGHWFLGQRGVGLIECGDVARNAQGALAWYDEEFIYCPKPALLIAGGANSTEESILNALKGAGVVAKRSGTWVFDHIPKVTAKGGRMPHYRLKRDAFLAWGTDTTAEAAADPF